MTLTDDPFAVSQPLEIQAILNGLLTQRILVRLEIPGRGLSIISTVLDLDRRTDQLILDDAAEDDLNAQFLRAPVVRLQGVLDRVMVEFAGTLSPGQYAGRSAFSMAPPTHLRRMQRREFFRVDIPADSAATCLIQSRALAPGGTRLRVLDLSAGGVRLADPEGLLARTPAGTILDHCTLELADTGPQDVSLRLLRHATILQENGRRLGTLACRFFNLPNNRQAAIQQYIGNLERAALARRRGHD